MPKKKEEAFEPTPNPHTKPTPGAPEDMVPRAVMNEKLAAAERHHKAEMVIATNALTAATTRATEAEESLSAASEFEGKYNDAVATHAKDKAENDMRSELVGLGVTDSEHTAVLLSRYGALPEEGRAELKDWMKADPIAQMVVGAATGKKGAPVKRPKVNNGVDDTKAQPKDVTLTNKAIQDMSIEELKANQAAIYGGDFEIVEAAATE